MIMESAEIGFGLCLCHARYDAFTAATRLDGLCDFCREHGPAGCQRAHQKIRGGLEMSLYFDREGQPIDVLAWGRNLENQDYRVVVQHWVRGWQVSTIWLGLDHSFGRGSPLIFETTIFPPGDEAGNGSIWSDQYCDRYATEAAARAGHDQALSWLREKLGDDSTADIAGPLTESSSDSDWDGTL